MDNITALKPAMEDVGLAVDAGPPAELPPNEIVIEPLDLQEPPKVRTKLRIYAILVALNVHYPVLVLNEHQLANNTSPLARLLRSSPRSNHHRNLHPHNLRYSALSFGLHLDRRRVLAGQRRSRSNLGQMQRHLGS